MTEYENYEDEGIDLTNFNKEEEIAKFKDLSPRGWQILVRLYTAPKKLGNVYIAEEFRKEDIYKNCVGLVVGIAPGAYKDARYEHTGPWCQIGEWVTFPRNSGYRIFFDDLPVWVLSEDVIGPGTPCPTRVTKHIN